MLRVNDVADKTFTTTRLQDGYVIDDVEGFRAEMVEALTHRDQLINEALAELAALEGRAADAGAGPRGPEVDRREGSLAAAKLLEMAALNADQVVAEATTQADSVMNAARAEAERLAAAGRVEAEREAVEHARRREQQAAELEQHRTTVLTDLERKKAALEAQVETLRQFEHDHRDHLRRHFSDQLAQLEDARPGVLRAVSGD
jgi:cell division septum initiation protein DivIVA